MELDFERDTAFRKRLFVAHSFSHPAKMNLHLLIWIVENYSKAGGDHTFTDEMLKEADKQIKWCDCCDT